jgi:LAO/AO transport system kinase
VLLTQAAADKGVDTLVAAIDKHRAWLEEHHDPARDRERRSREFMEVLTAEVEERVARALGNGEASSLIADVQEGRINPYSATRAVIGGIGKLLSRNNKSA